MNIIFLDIDGVLNSERLADRLVSQGYTEANYDFIDLNELTRFVYFINKYIEMKDGNIWEDATNAVITYEENEKIGYFIENEN